MLVALQSRKCLTQMPPDARPLSSRDCAARHPPLSGSPARDTGRGAYQHLPLASYVLYERNCHCPSSPSLQPEPRPIPLEENVRVRCDCAVVHFEQGEAEFSAARKTRPMEKCLILLADTAGRDNRGWMLLRADHVPLSS
jgi:hypothetical protein